MILAIDLGEKTSGLAISESSLATPYKTITHQNQEEAVAKVAAICQDLGVDTIVLGFVEGKIKTMFNTFASKIQNLLSDIHLVMWDETLTSGQATQTMIKLAVPKLKRREKQHEVAAAIILQSYLDTKQS